MNKALNALGFQSVWWAFIWGVGAGYELLAMAYAGLLGWVHWFRTDDRPREFKLAGVALALGVLTDSLLQWGSVISFHGMAIAPLSPFWLWLLWGLFAMTLNESLSFLQTQALWVSSLAGLVFGPVTYYAGAQWGAAQLSPTPMNLAVLGLAWALVMPALVRVAPYFSERPHA